jgi:hypothetical protein
LELCGVIGHLSPMALYCLVCAFGQQRLVTVLTRCGLPLPMYFLADEKHSHCLTENVYIPTIVCGRVIWHLGYTEDAGAAAFTQSYGVFQRAALQQEPSYRVRGILTDGFDSTTKSLRVFALGQRLRHFADHVAATAGVANGERVRRWFQDKKAGWYAVLEDPRMPVTSTLLDQAHNAIERILFRDEGVPSSWWQPTGVSHRAGTPVQPGTISAPGPACGAVWRGSGGRTSTHSRLVPQSADPHLRRLPMSGVTLHH